MTKKKGFSLKITDPEQAAAILGVRGRGTSWPSAGAAGAGAGEPDRGDQDDDEDDNS